MATGFFYQQFYEDIAHGVHNLGSDALTAYLTNTAPSASADALYGDLTSPVSTNLSTRVFGTPTTSAQTSGVYTLLLPDLILTATSGTPVADFSHAGIYNDDTAAPAPVKALIGGWAIGSTISGMVSPNTFTFDFTTYTIRFQ